jgi:hypothetical protein
MDAPELADTYREYFQYGVLPAYGLYARHARGLTLDGVRFDLATVDARPAVVCDDVADLEIARLRADCGADAAIVLRAIRDATIRECRAVGDAPALAKQVGDDCGGLWMSGNRVGPPA